MSFAPPLEPDTESTESKLAEPGPVDAEPLVFENAEEQDFWRDVWVAVAGDSSVRTSSTPTKWADYALQEYRKRKKPRPGGPYR